MHASEQYVRPALLAGASGYLVKDAAPAELETAIHAAFKEIFDSLEINLPIGFFRNAPSTEDSKGRENQINVFSTIFKDVNLQNISIFKFNSFISKDV